MSFKGSLKTPYEFCSSNFCIKMKCFYCIFCNFKIYLICMAERESEREIFHLLIYFSNGTIATVRVGWSRNLEFNLDLFSEYQGFKYLGHHTLRLAEGWNWKTSWNLNLGSRHQSHIIIAVRTLNSFYLSFPPRLLIVQFCPSVAGLFSFIIMFWILSNVVACVRMLF